MGNARLQEMLIKVFSHCNDHLLAHDKTKSFLSTAKLVILFVYLKMHLKTTVQGCILLQRDEKQESFQVILESLSQLEARQSAVVEYRPRTSLCRGWLN